MNTKLIRLFIIFAVVFNTAVLFAQEGSSEQAQEAYRKPNFLEPKELMDRAKQCLADGKLDDARLYALRMYFDGTRNTNLLNLLGVIEIQAGRPLLGSEWLRKACSLTVNNKVAQRYLPRLPQKPRAIPVDPMKLTDHFAEIANGLPKLVEKLENSKLHFEAVLKALERGQMYLALALSEEYEKKYPGTADGAGLSALCAWYLGRNGDAVKVIEENIKKDPYNSVLLFVQAMINDMHPATVGGNYFRALYDFDQWEKALNIAEQYNKQNPNSPDAYITLARILLELHKTKEAGEALQEAGIRDPGNPEIEILWVNYMLQRDDKEKASRRLVNAFKRGYNLPSVNLTAGVFAMQDGKIDEVNVIIDEASACMPFSDPEAYPIYVSLVLTLDRLTDARRALNYWKPRSAEKSMYCYMEAFYYFKANKIKNAIEWLSKAFELNPFRVDVLRFMVALPILQQEDPNLHARINNQLSNLTKGFVNMKVPAKIIPQPEKEKAPGIAAVGAAVVSGNFKIALGNGIDESGRTMLVNELNEMYNRIASRIGTIKEPVNIKFVSAENMGPTIVSYDANNSMITVTSNYYDSEMLRNIILANFDALSEDEITSLVEEYPGHLLAAALTRYMIHHQNKETVGAASSNSWMVHGLAEILAGSNYTQRYRLLVAQKSTNDQTAKIAPTESINSIFTGGYMTPAISETSTAQAYLMAAFLIKKEGLGKGCKKMLELINKVSSGSDLDSALKATFNINVNDFNRGWKDAAYWAMQQGTPYEWQ